MEISLAEEHAFYFILQICLDATLYRAENKER